MKVCVYGAGAVGGHIAARLLAAGGADVSLIARGAHLDAINRDGLRLRSGGIESCVRPFAASDSPATLPPQDLVIVALKAPALPAAAAAIHRLLGAEGVALFVVNGIPWWWRHGLPGTAGPLPLLDPAGSLWHLLRERALGGICLASGAVVRPGVIETTLEGGLVVGEPAGSSSARLAATAGLLRQAGFDVRESADLRGDIWDKLLTNAALNPLSALTRQATIAMTTNPDLRACMVRVITEVAAVASADGRELRPDVDAMLAPQRRPHAHRTSMLQDVLGGRALETEALLGQVVEFARQAGVATPCCDLLLTLLRGLDGALRPPGTTGMKP
jgi:2-dehydropantoate 2-reductase